MGLTPLLPWFLWTIKQCKVRYYFLYFYSLISPFISPFLFLSNKTNAPLDKIKEYLFPHLMEGTGLVLQSISEWWDLMKERCDINKNGILELKDMEV